MALLPFLVLPLAFGCGGGAYRVGARGKIRFTVAWPEAQTRVIPASAQSLVVQVKNGATVVDSRLIVRPASTTTFSSVPVGALIVDVKAYASTDGTGTVLAQSSVPAVIADNGTTNVDVTLVSTIDRLDVTPNPLTIGAALTGNLNVVAKDASGSVVLVVPSALSFSSSNPSVASVDANGLVTASSLVGSTSITVTEGDSGKTASVPVSIVPTVSVTPASASVTLRGTQLFVATVVGPTNVGVTWSVQEGAAGGSITSAGLYTAPTSRGTYHVVATSVADSSRTAVATVNVSGGSLNVSVH